MMTKFTEAKLEKLLIELLEQEAKYLLNKLDRIDPLNKDTKDLFDKFFDPK